MLEKIRTLAVCRPYTKKLLKSALPIGICVKTASKCCRVGSLGMRFMLNISLGPFIEVDAMYRKGSRKVRAASVRRV
jgi:hypothetical protein